MTAARALLALQADPRVSRRASTHRTRRLLGIALFACLLAVARGSSPAYADAAALPAGYTDIIDEAVEEATRGNFAEARALFGRAHALYPNARTLRGLAMMAYELRSYSESISYYEQALLSRERALDAALRADAEAQVQRARRFVAELKLALTPPAVHITVDGRPVALSSSGQLRLDPGQHTLLFEAAGYRSETRALDVHGGEDLLWTIALPLASTEAGAHGAPEQAADRGGPRSDQQPKKLYRNPWLWAGVALAAGAIATGLGLGLSQRSKKTVEDAPTVSQQSPPDAVIYAWIKP